ncbi:conserved hypothetical protein [delta proteobacterium NaphS2]|nr:conserved hypothetical protein [delta proteobacterium NaphS2]
MKKSFRKFPKIFAAIIPMALLALAVGFVTPPGARADEEDAKRLVKAMSDYMAAQNSISLAYDAILEIVTKDHQKLGLASSGTVDMKRPDKLRATRTGGFADVEMLFDGKMLTLFGKNANLYAQVEIPGTIDHLIDELRVKYHKTLPAADLLMTNIYDQLMPAVIDIKDLGSGVISGVECDHLAFRTKEVDWEIWIAHGDHPHPCRYVITSKLITDAPQYSILVREWKTGDEVTVDDFKFKNSTKAKKIDLKDIPELNELPKHFMTGGAK